MSLQRMARLDVALAIIIAGLAIGSLAIRLAGYLDDHPYHLAADDYSIELVEVFLFGAAGLLIAVRRPGHSVGKALLLSAVGIGSYTFFGSYAEYALATRQGLPLDLRLAATAYSAIWPLIVGGMFYLLLLFPTGKAPNRASETVGRIWAVAAAGEILGYFVIPGHLAPPYEYISSPLAIEALRPIGGFAILFAAFILGSTAVAGINLLMRFRRSRGVEREQFRWMLFPALIVIPSTFLTGFPALATLGAVFQLAAFAGFPIAVGIAILRYRLYDIDRIINRTLVYALLTAGLGATYFGLVVGLQAALQSLSGGSNLAIALTTLLVAALFLPARGRVQTAVDRRFNRRSYDAARTVDAFALRLREQIDLDTLRYELLAVVDETMQPQQASLWLRTTGTGR